MTDVTYLRAMNHRFIFSKAKNNLLHIQSLFIAKSFVLVALILNYYFFFSIWSLLLMVTLLSTTHRSRSLFLVLRWSCVWAGFFCFPVLIVHILTCVVFRGVNCVMLTAGHGKHQLCSSYCILGIQISSTAGY